MSIALLVASYIRNIIYHKVIKYFPNFDEEIADGSPMPIISINHTNHQIDGNPEFIVNVACLSDKDSKSLNVHCRMESSPPYDVISNPSTSDSATNMKKSDSSVYSTSKDCQNENLKASISTRFLQKIIPNEDDSSDFQGRNDEKSLTKDEVTVNWGNFIFEAASDVISYLRKDNICVSTEERQIDNVMTTRSRGMISDLSKKYSISEVLTIDILPYSLKKELCTEYFEVDIPPFEPLYEVLPNPLCAQVSVNDCTDYYCRTLFCSHSTGESQNGYKTSFMEKEPLSYDDSFFVVSPSAHNMLSDSSKSDTILHDVEMDENSNLQHNGPQKDNPEAEISSKPLQDNIQSPLYLDSRDSIRVGNYDNIFCDCKLAEFQTEELTTSTIKTKPSFDKYFTEALSAKAKVSVISQEDTNTLEEKVDTPSYINEKECENEFSESRISRCSQDEKDLTRRDSQSMDSVNFVSLDRRNLCDNVFRESGVKVSQTNGKLITGSRGKANRDQIYSESGTVNTLSENIKDEEKVAYVVGRIVKENTSTEFKNTIRQDYKNILNHTVDPEEKTELRRRSTHKWQACSSRVSQENSENIKVDAKVIIPTRNDISKQDFNKKSVRKVWKQKYYSFMPYFAKIQTVRIDESWDALEYEDFCSG